MLRILMTSLLCLNPLAGLAGDVEIVKVVATAQGDAWRFDVTLAHGDTGWDHYANGWKVFADGQEVGYRELFHPHVNEQPFTRSLSSVQIPDGTSEVTIRASDSVHGWSESFAVELN